MRAGLRASGPITVVVFLALGSSGSLYAQDDKPAAPTPISRQVFVSVGIDNYETCPHSGERECWPHLPTPVRDTTDMGTLLHKEFSFDVPDILQLKDSGASKAAIIKLVEETLREYVKPDDDVVFMFSGHGTRSDGDVKGADGKSVTVTRGFLVPWDARLIESSDSQHVIDFIDACYLLEALNSLPVRHVLVILDSCNSGLALKCTGGVPKGGRLPEDVIRGKIGRKVIAAAQADEEAASSTADDERHSLFTGMILSQLGPGSSYGEAGFLTGRELGDNAFVALKDKPVQEPGSGKFYDDDGGDVVFHFPISIPAVIKRARIPLDDGMLEQFKQTVQPMIASYPDSPQSEWAQYRLDLREGNITHAHDMLAKLITRDDLDPSLMSQAKVHELEGVLDPDNKGEYPHFMNFPKVAAKEKSPLSFVVKSGAHGEGNALPSDLDSPESLSLYANATMGRPIQIVATNTSGQALHVQCLSISALGELSGDLCGVDIDPGKQLTMSSTVWEPKVTEFHFYVQPPAEFRKLDSGGYHTSSEGGIQTSIRIQFVKQEITKVSTKP